MGGIQNNPSLRGKPVPRSSRTPPVSLAPKIPIAFPRSNTCHAGYGTARRVSRPRSSTSCRSAIGEASCLICARRRQLLNQPNKYNQTLYARQVK